MNSNIKISQIVKEAFPLLLSATYVRRFASLVPLVPDTTFDIFVTELGKFLTLVATDYADPQDQGRELREVSGQYELDFVNLIKPYANDNQTVAIVGHDDMEGDFLIREAAIYYYLANTKSSFTITPTH